MGESREPKYRAIADELRLAISSPEFDPDKPLDPERALSKRYDVSAATVRKAIALLRAEGLVDVRHGSGVYKRTWKPILRDATKRLSAEQWGAGRAIWDADVGDRLVTLGSLEVRYDRAPSRVADLLGAEDVLVRDRTYLVDYRPVQLAVSYIPAEVARGTAIERRDSGPGGTFARLAEAGLAPVEFTETVRARTPSPDEQAKLRITAERPVAEIVRCAFTQTKRIIEVTSMVLDGEAYVMQWSFTS